ncbi:alpha-ketoacid dehydrogenase subunit beta [Pseudonocardia thermophila]|mgnify:CR=1 FL=1|uniref:alpha-ketoacid dehydrogenase subunit beta n=1 Tax=Pseudonocardia thermophila TaxID=1848 RepID=UPI00248E5665|nr:pyruvate dehydrogenase complex E1 component subunit beta [Pseudonocardia thermophila]
MTAVAQPQHDTGSQTTMMSFAQAVNRALDHALAEDSRVILLGEDIEDPAGGVFKVTAGLSSKYGRNRVRNTPIAEQAIVGAAIGAALGGLRPVAEIMVMDFITVAMDQPVNHAAKLRYMSGGRTGVPITVRTAVGGNRGTGAQHSTALEAWFMHTPGINVVAPSTPADAKGLMSSCLATEDPCLFLEPMALMPARGPVPDEHYSIPLGRSDVKAPGSDVTIITYGWQVPEALAAAETLDQEGISAEVVDLRTLVPLDTAGILESVSRTKRAAIVHAATEFAGPGAEIASIIHHELFGELAAPVERIGAALAPVPFARNLETALFPSRDRIADRVRAMVDGRPATRNH